MVKASQLLKGYVYHIQTQFMVVDILLRQYINTG